MSAPNFNCHHNSRHLNVFCIWDDFDSYKEDGKTEIRWWQSQCWKRMTKKDLECGGEIRDIKASEFHFGAELPHGYARNRQLCIKKYQEAAKRYLIVDGSVWLRCGEPRYVVNTFGLGHNHGGTGLFVEEFYNSNISNTNYFIIFNYYSTKWSTIISFNILFC